MPETSGKWNELFAGSVGALEIHPGGIFFEIFDTGAISRPVIAAVHISMCRYTSYRAAVPVTHNDWN